MFWAIVTPEGKLYMTDGIVSTLNGGTYIPLFESKAEAEIELECAIKWALDAGEDDDYHVIEIDGKTLDKYAVIHALKR